ncbi:MAG: ribonuclease Z [Pseudomonadota bacterium]|nr:MAG: ribonuclease Z [Pseudomonadota bacterium]
MKPLFHPQLVNDPFGDPGLYVDFLFERRALLFDLGDLHALAPRKILRLSHVFVSHTHMDHFVGFDQILRVCLGRDRQLTLFGPPGFIAQLGHKLAAYTWNLVGNYDNDFSILAYEVGTDATAGARFRCRSAFACEPVDAPPPGAIIVDEESFSVRATALDHRIPCLAFALEEKQHINVWKNRLAEYGFPTGAWLRELKQAVMRGVPDDSTFRVWWRDGDGIQERLIPLGELCQKVLRIVPGQKIAYVVDAVYHEQNAQRIAALARDADVLYIEAGFLDEQAERAAQTFHLTARQAGGLARAARARHVVPFHYSARHSDQAAHLAREVEAAFRGQS